MKCDRLRALLAKIEGTAGAAESLSGTDGVTPAFNVQYSDNTPFTVRENNTGGKLPGRRGAKLGTLSFDIEAMGDGSSGVPPWADLYLPACGFVKATTTFTYTRVYANQKTLTLRSYVDGQYRQLYGAAGALRFTYNAGATNYFNFTFTGIVSDIAEASNTAVTLDTTQAPLGAVYFNYYNGTGDVTLKAPTAVIDWGSVIQPVESANTTGYERFCVSDVNATMTVEPYAEAHSVVSFDADWVANSERAVSLRVGDAGYNSIVIAASKASSNRPPGWGERGRLATRSLSLDFNDDNGPTIAFPATSYSPS